MATSLGKRDISELSASEVAEVEAEYLTRMEALKRRKSELAKQSFYEVQKVMEAKNISSSAMIEFLQEFSAEEGVLVKYPYVNDKGVQKTFMYRENQRGKNQFLIDIAAKKITKEQAQSYAVGTDGAKYVAGLFK